MGTNCRQSEPNTRLLDQIDQILCFPVRHPSEFLLYLFTDTTMTLQHDSTPSDDDEALMVLDVVRAQREVRRAEQALAESLANQHETMSKFYRLKRRTTEDTVHRLELGIGSIRVAMKRHGLAEPIPCHTSPIPTGSHRTYHNPDGTLIDRYS